MRSTDSPPIAATRPFTAHSALRAAALATTVLCSGLAAPAFAQDEVETARRYDATSPGGVSYPSGAYSYQLPLLSIGQGEFPQALVFGLSYNSGGARGPNTAWAHNLIVRISRTLIDDPAAEVPEPDGKPHPEWRTYLHNVVIGQRSAGFEKYGHTYAGAPYQPVTKTGETLTFSGDETSGYFTYTGNQGEVITFTPRNDPYGRHADNWVEPDGTTLTYSYAPYFSIASNRGLALFLETPVTVGSTTTRKACVLNLTKHYLPSITACPAGALSASVVADTAGDIGFTQVSSATRADGGTYNYQYSYSNAGGKERRHLNCVKEPGQSTCSVANVYDECDGRMGTYVPGAIGTEDPAWNGSRDRVVTQTFATGETLTYQYPVETGACRGNESATMTDADNAQTAIDMNYNSGVVEKVTDPLSRLSSFTYTGATPTFTSEDKLIATITSPEGDKIEYIYDDRGNKTETRQKAKAGSGLADIVTSAAYPATCSNAKTCNKPISVTDAKGNATDYTYDATHGGVLTETGPAVGGVRPQKRYSYAQRYAWIKTASGGYAQAASPVWVLASEEYCRTSTATGGNCATGAGDEVVTAYDYGPNSGPNNLWLRGVAVTAADETGTIVTLRTCYGYDDLGRKISETQPNANLSSCS